MKPSNFSSGMTLVELMLYIGIFSIIFAGFITFTFEFSRTVAVSVGREEAKRQGAIIGEFVRWKVHQAEHILVPTEGATSTELELEMGDGLPNIEVRGEEVERLFRFEEFKKPTGLYFYMGKSLDLFFSLNSKEYKIEVELL